MPRTDTPASAGPFDRRLLAEALRHHEEASGELDDAAAVLRAIASGGDFEQRLLTRAEALAPGLGLEAALAGLHRRVRLLLVAGLGAAFLGGAGAARAVLGSPEAGPTNFYLVLVVMLGLHVLALCLWLVWLPWAGALPVRSPLPGLLLGLLRAQTGGGPGRAALGAWVELHAAPGLARWALGSLSHALWLSALAGMLAMSLLALSARQYDFVWETTIVPAERFVALTDWLGAGPRALGWTVPDAALTAASRRAAPAPADPGLARAAWSGLLLGALVLYGLAPRAALLALCLLMLARGRRALALRTELPGYARLQPRLLPAAARRGVVDPAPPASPRPAPDLAPERALRPVPGTPVLALEIERPASGWPPPLLADPVDLGMVRDRRALEQAIGELRRLRRPPLVIASLLASPDRGLLRALTAVNAEAPAQLLLTQGSQAGARLGAEGLTRRVEDWRALASSAGLDSGAVHLLDLDDLQAVRERLLAADGGASP